MFGSKLCIFLLFFFNNICWSCQRCSELRCKNFTLNISSWESRCSNCIGCSLHNETNRAIVFIAPLIHRKYLPRVAMHKCTMCEVEIYETSQLLAIHQKFCHSNATIFIEGTIVVVPAAADRTNWRNAKLTAGQLVTSLNGFQQPILHPLLLG